MPALHAWTADSQSWSMLPVCLLHDVICTVLRVLRRCGTINTPGEFLAQAAAAVYEECKTRDVRMPLRDD